MFVLKHEATFRLQEEAFMAALEKQRIGDERLNMLREELREVAMQRRKNPMIEQREITLLKRKRMQQEKQARLLSIFIALFTGG